MGVRETLLGLLTERGLAGSERAICDLETTPLFSSSALSSVDLMCLVLEVEGEIGRTLPNSEVTLDNFDSILAVERLVARCRTTVD